MRKLSSSTCVAPSKYNSIDGQRTRKRKAVKGSARHFGKLSGLFCCSFSHLIFLYQANLALATEISTSSIPSRAAKKIITIRTGSSAI